MSSSICNLIKFFVIVFVILVAVDYLGYVDFFGFVNTGETIFGASEIVLE